MVKFNKSTNRLCLKAKHIEERELNRQNQAIEKANRKAASSRHVQKDGAITMGITRSQILERNATEEEYRDSTRGVVPQNLSIPATKIQPAPPSPPLHTYRIFVTSGYITARQNFLAFVFLRLFVIIAPADDQCRQPVPNSTRHVAILWRFLDLGADSLRPHMYKYRWISRYSSVVSSIIQFIYMSSDSDTSISFIIFPRAPHIGTNFRMR